MCFSLQISNFFILSAYIQAALDSFIESTFNPSNYSSGACMARDVEGKPLVTLPDAFGRQVLSRALYFT